MALDNKDLTKNIYFQYCPKLVVFNKAMDQVLLAKRKGEQDYDGIFTFIGGKLETSDGGIIEGIKREKNEEIGVDVRIKIAEMSVFNAYFEKRDGSSMILPHHICKYLGGDIKINEEYSEYQWVDLNDLKDFGPKIDTIIPAVEWAKRFFGQLQDEDFLII